MIRVRFKPGSESLPDGSRSHFQSHPAFPRRADKPVVSNARFITIEKENDPKKYIATVEHIAHDCDLALLKVGDRGFFT